ncbi:Y-family DNA polymerase [Olivibacter domesticus]|uniref:Protein ImuB n=1 Tax=Olivibacter domesticus TaxID=407022 RepID=A0A1H7KL30_OLID1|nr:DNA polymerase Y family protein [Olivibacter domesticus]SEK87244.1 protein ImuB [Olivibacter domesticus]
MKRYVAIWFRHLLTDRLAKQQPELKGLPFVLAAPERGRMMIQAVSPEAAVEGIRVKMVLADARALYPTLQVFDFEPEGAEKILRRLAEWCLRYAPLASVDLPDGLLLDASGCAHLWKGEKPYLREITTKLRSSGYDVRVAMADTVGAAWAIARYGKVSPLVAPGCHVEALLPLPPIALRLETAIAERMQKLGLVQIGDFIQMPRVTLRRRFGQPLLDRLGQAMGTISERLEPICPVVVYQERLPCLEPVRTRKSIEIALERLLQTLTDKLAQDSQGLRKAVFRSFRLDGKIKQVEIGTGRASRDCRHLFGLFKEKISTIAPGLGIELFLLEAPVVEPLDAQQEKLWIDGGAYQQAAVSNLLDRIAGRVGYGSIRRYLPDEHHWPERSIKLATSLDEEPARKWPTGEPRPIYLLPKPEPILVAAPIPDYPPMSFTYKGKIHTIRRADGPERIEREWWIEMGLQRDYYRVEDMEGARYWVFRSGHYDQEQAPEWFIHGFFA